VRLWLVRHARPLIAEGICYGRLDVAADRLATRALAHRLAEALPAGIDVVSSPLQRCAQLASELGALRPDLGLRCDDRLQEMDFGAWEGRPWNAIDRRELDAWTHGFLHYRAGGHGESVAMFTARVSRIFDETAGGEQAWLTHGGVFKAACLRRRRAVLKAAADWPAQALPWGEWHLFEES